MSSDTGTQRNIADAETEFAPMSGLAIIADELTKAVDNITLSLPGSWETINSVNGSLTEIVRFGLPDDHFDTYAEAIRGVSSEDASAVARKFLDPDRMVWVVVGDRAEIEDKIRELGFGEVRVLTEDLAQEPIAMAN